MSHEAKLSLRRRDNRRGFVASLICIAALATAALALGQPPGSARASAPEEPAIGVSNAGDSNAGDSGSPAPPFRDESRVVAVDVMVSVKRSKGGQWLRGDATPKEVAADASRVRAGNTERRVVALQPAADKGQPTDEPWTVVLWFDAAFANSTSLRWAAESLGQVAERLTALGTVEVLLAGDTGLGSGVRQVTPPTRDPAELSDALSRMAVEAPPGDDTLRRLRAEFLTVADREPALAKDLAEHAVGLEQTLVQGRHDLLLASLIDTRLIDRDTRSPRRALFLVTDGWDADPAAFYLHELKADRGPQAATSVPEARMVPASDPPAVDLATAVASRTLAAYGWLVYPLLAPPPPPPPHGFYIGKWFFHRPTFKPKKGTAAVPIPMLPGIAATRKKYLDPERARAFLALGHALLGQDQLEDAIEAFEKAIFHFQNDKRTQKEQADAWAALGAAFERAGRSEDTLRAFERVVQLDPSRAAQLGGVARLLAPTRPLTALAETTSGLLVQGDDDLRRALEDLRWRMRLTFELAGPPAGELLPLTITHRGGLHITSPAWARSATPPEVTALRARRLLTEPVEPSELGASWPLDLSIEVDEAGTWVARVAVDTTSFQTEGVTHYLRPTLVARAGDATPLASTIVIHGPVKNGSSKTDTPDPNIWHWTFDLTTVLEDFVGDEEETPPVLAIIVDELDTGTWGGGVIALEDVMRNP